MTPPILELRSVDAGYGKFRVLFGLSLSVAAESRLAVLGPNGAGKTTLVRVCSGLLEPAGGEVFLDGDPIAGVPVHELRRRGVVHLPEGRAVFGSLTVEENLEVFYRQALGRRRVGGALEQTYGMFPKLGERRRQPATTLSGGEQRLLALARVVVAPPRLLLVDEVSLGLDPDVLGEVHRWLRHLAGQGTTLMLVEQRLDEVADLVAEVAWLVGGRVRGVGPVAAAAEAGRRILGS